MQLAVDLRGCVFILSRAFSVTRYEDIYVIFGANILQSGISIYKLLHYVLWKGPSAYEEIYILY